MLRSACPAQSKTSPLEVTAVTNSMYCIFFFLFFLNGNVAVLRQPVRSQTPSQTGLSKTADPAEIITYVQFM